MMPACCSNPSSSAPKTCQLCGDGSTAWKEWSTMTTRSVPFTTRVSRSYIPAGMTHDRAAQHKITTDIIVNVWGILVIFICSLVFFRREGTISRPHIHGY